MTRQFVPGDEEPQDVREVGDSFACNWMRTPDGWYPSEGGYHRRTETWWWLTMNRGPLWEK